MSSEKPGDLSTPRTIRRVVARAIPLVFCSFLPLAASSFSFSLRVDFPAHRPKWLLKLLPRYSIGCSNAFFQRHSSFYCPVGSPIRIDRGFLSRSIESRVQSSSRRLTGQKIEIGRKSTPTAFRWGRHNTVCAWVLQLPLIYPPVSYTEVVEF